MFTLWSLLGAPSSLLRPSTAAHENVGSGCTDARLARIDRLNIACWRVDQKSMTERKCATMCEGEYPCRTSRRATRPISTRPQGPPGFHPTSSPVHRPTIPGRLISVDVKHTRSSLTHSPTRQPRASPRLAFALTDGAGLLGTSETPSEERAASTSGGN